MKTLPQFLPNQFYKLILGIVLLGLCPPLISQTEPLAIPQKINYPGIIETFEKLIQIDQEKNQKKIGFTLDKAKCRPYLCTSPVKQKIFAPSHIWGGGEHLGD